MAGLIIVCHGEDCPHRMDRDHPMTCIDETHGHWVFRCATCLNARAVDKQHAGGTQGAGRREDQPALKYPGRGFHAAT